MDQITIHSAPTHTHTLLLAVYPVLPRSGHERTATNVVAWTTKSRTTQASKLVLCAIRAIQILLGMTLLWICGIPQSGALRRSVIRVGTPIVSAYSTLLLLTVRLVHLGLLGLLALCLAS